MNTIQKFQNVLRIFMGVEDCTDRQTNKSNALYMQKQQQQQQQKERKKKRHAPEKLVLNNDE